MANILNWVGLSALIIGFGSFALIGFKRSAWWGPSKRVSEDLDSTEISIVKAGFIFIILGTILFVIANVS